MILLEYEDGDGCPQEFVNNFAKQFSIPTYKYENPTTVNRFRRYPTWLNNRNRLIYGFTEYKDKFYMIADKNLDLCINLYGWCSECKILRCSPIWCICGHKELSNEWTSGNESLDKFIKETQTQTESANEAYLEWIPFEMLNCCSHNLSASSTIGMPTYSDIDLVLLETSEETDELDFQTVNSSLIISKCLKT